MHDFQIHIGEQSRKEKAVLKSERALSIGVGRETHRAENPSQEALFSSRINQNSLLKVCVWTVDILSYIRE